MYSREIVRGAGVFDDGVDLISRENNDATPKYSQEEVFGALDMLTVNQREMVLAACNQGSVFSRMMKQLVDGGIGDALRKADDNERHEIFERFVAYGIYNSQERALARCRLVGAGLLRLTARDGTLGGDGERFRNFCLDSDRPLEAVQALRRAIEYEGKAAQWWISFQWASVLFTEVEKSSDSRRAYTEFSVAGVPDRLPIAWGPDFSAGDIPAMRLFSDMSDEEKRIYLSEQAIAEGHGKKNIVPFDALNRDTKTAVLAQQLFKSEVLSRDSQMKDQSSERNRKLSMEKDADPFRPGSLVHSTEEVDTLRRILSGGIVCGEAIGKNADYDFFPFNVDVAKVEVTKDRPTPLLDYLYEYPISIVLHRDNTELGPDLARNVRESRINNHHVIFGAVPATDISAIVYMPSARASYARMLPEIVDVVVENGMYVPVYRYGEKQPILSFEEYQRRRNDIRT